jgi:AraC-like DNA-binding protein
MLDRSSKHFATADPLSEMLRGLRLDGVDYGRCELAAPWGIAFPQQLAARFHFIGREKCWLLTPGKEWIELNPGDAILLPRGGEHVLASAPNIPAIPLDGYSIEEVSKDIFDVQGGADGPKTLLFCGSMRFSLDSLHPLLAMMPDVMRGCDLVANQPGFLNMLRAMTDEVEMERVGSGGILARLADVVAASIIRAWVESGCGEATGWIAAVRNPEIGRVLSAIHLEPSRDWTVAALARVMGASRSGFAERFTTIVGETPARYLTQVRMHQARQWLIRDRLKIAVVARRLGYESEASFSRAFKRVIGFPPGHFRAAAKDRAA